MAWLFAEFRPKSKPNRTALSLFHLRSFSGLIDSILVLKVGFPFATPPKKLVCGQVVRRCGGYRHHPTAFEQFLVGTVRRSG